MTKCWIRWRATHVAVERPVLIVLDGADINQRFRIDRPEIVVGRDLMGGFFVNDARCSRRHFKLFFSNFDQPGKAPEVFIEDLKSTNGTYVNGERLTERMPLKDRDKIMIGSTLLGFFVQDQYQMQADQRLLDLATIDALTGLSNRGMFNREFVKEFDRARRYRRSMALVIFDIDHFKHFNDTYGHPPGTMSCRRSAASRSRISGSTTSRPVTAARSSRSSCPKPRSRAR